MMSVASQVGAFWRTDGNFRKLVNFLLAWDAFLTTGLFKACNVKY